MKKIMIGYLIIGFNLNAGINKSALLKIAKVPQKAIYIAQPKEKSSFRCKSKWSHTYY